MSKKDLIVCPSCEAKTPSTSVGPEGSADWALTTCQHCEVTFDRYTLNQFDKPEKKARKSLNPQGVIDKKVSAVAATGFELSYSKATRQWKLCDPKEECEQSVMWFTSKELSVVTAEGLVLIVEGLIEYRTKNPIQAGDAK